jgi:hypothetical protein
MRPSSSVLNYLNRVLEHCVDPQRGFSRAVFLLGFLTLIFLVQSGVAQNPPSASTPRPPGAGSAQTAPQSQNPPQQPPPSQQLSTTVPEATKLMVDFQNTLTGAASNYQSFLEKQEERHQKFLEWIYGLTSGFVAIGTAVVIFFNFKSRKDIKEIVDERINVQTDDEVRKAKKEAAEQMGEFKKILDGQIASAALKVTEFDNSIGEIKRFQEELKVNHERNIKIVVTLSRAWSVLVLPKPADDAKSEIQRIAERCRSVLEKFEEITEWLPTNRHIAILYGRLYIRLGDFNGAILVLDQALAKRDQANLDKDKDEDTAALLYNKACYINLKANLENDPSEKENLRILAWQAIQKSLLLRPKNLKEAINDSDFTGLTGGTRQW